jgi:threonine aldolase
MNSTTKNPTSKTDFRSDTVTQPTHEMREAMMAAPLGDDVFGDDPSVNTLQEYAAAQFGFEAAIFAPTGTQTNLMALMAHCERGDEAIVGQAWHTYKWEAGGMAVLGSIQPQPVENQPDGSLALNDILAAIKPDDPHFARTKLIVIENTTGGKVLPVAYVESVGELAKTNGLALHLDGARIMNAAVSVAAQSMASQRTPSHQDCMNAAQQLAAPFNSMSLCLSKGLGAPIGSLLLGTKPFIARARRIRKMLGGGMRQAGLLAAAGQHALTYHVARLSLDHLNAKTLASGLAQFGFLKVSASQTNILFVDVEPALADRFAAHLKEAGVLVTGTTRQRWVTHLDLDQESVARALAAVSSFKP